MIIYLDQSRVSEMVRVVRGTDPSAAGPHRADYEALYPRLLELLERRRIVCPFSLWHAIESIQFDDDDIRAGVCEFFDAASCNRSFRFYQDVFERELLALAGEHRLHPLGDGLDCFPSGAIAPLTRDFLDGSSRAFTTVVEFVRSDRAFRQCVIETRDAMIDGIRNYVEHYHGTFDEGARTRRPMPPLSTIRSELGRDVVRTHLRNLVDRGLPMAIAQQVFGAATEAIEHSSWGEDRIPALGAWVETLAARVHRGGKVDTDPRRRGEAFDLCHMAALASVDVFLMERQYTGIGATAAKHARTRLVHAPAHLLAELATL